MNELAYEKIATRARELLDVRPRPTTQDVADLILAEIAEEFEVQRRPEFVERLRPAMTSVVGSARGKLIRELEEAAARAYLAKPLPSADVLARSETQPMLPSPMAALGTGMDGHDAGETHDSSAILPVPEPGVHPGLEIHPLNDASAAALGGQGSSGTQPGLAAQPEPGRTDGDQMSCEAQSASVVPSAPESVAIGDSQSNAPSLLIPGQAANRQSPSTHLAPPVPVTPLSLRAEHLEGWRPLRDELLYVPEYEDVTYGNATAMQRQRAMTYYHSMAGGYMAKSRRMRALDEAIKASGAATLNEMLDGRALAGRES